MKVLRGISLIAIASCIVLVGCSSTPPINSQTTQPPSLQITSSKAVPVISQPMLRGQENSPHFALEIAVNNPGPGKLKADIEIKGAPSEVLNSHRLSGLGAGKGTTLFTICEVTRKRTKPIFIKVKWRHDSKSGTSSFAVAPEQNNLVRK